MTGMACYSCSLGFAPDNSISATITKFFGVYKYTNLNKGP
jgi:hypothetical protein